MESELSEVGIVKEQIEAFLVKYNKELAVSSSRVRDLEDQLSYEQDGSTSLKMENERLRKRLNAKTSHERELEDRIAELERILKAAEEAANAIAHDKKDVDDAKNKAEEKHYAATRKLTSLVKENNQRIKESEDKTEEQRSMRDELEFARSRATEANFLSARLQEEMKKVEEMHKSEDRLSKEIAEARQEASEARKLSTGLEEEMKKVGKLTCSQVGLLKVFNIYKVRAAEADDVSERLSKEEKQMKLKNNSVKKLTKVFERTNAVEARDFSRTLEDQNKKLQGKTEEQKILREY